MLRGINGCQGCAVIRYQRSFRANALRFTAEGTQSAKRHSQRYAADLQSGHLNVFRAMHRSLCWEAKTAYILLIRSNCHPMPFLHMQETDCSGMCHFCGGTCSIEET